MMIRALLGNLLLLVLLCLPALAVEPFGEGENYPGPPAPKPERTPKPRPTLQDELLLRAARDQDARFKWMTDSGNEELRATVEQVDRENTEWFRDWLDEHGKWPLASEVGTDAARAAFLLVQHSPDKAFQRRCLDLMTPLLEKGEVNPLDWAYLLDRVRLGEGGKQVYGSQITLGADGVISVAPLEDPEHVDERRAAIGMPPLAEYLKLVEDTYRRRPGTP